MSATLKFSFMLITLTLINNIAKIGQILLHLFCNFYLTYIFVKTCASHSIAADAYFIKCLSVHSWVLLLQENENE